MCLQVSALRGEHEHSVYYPAPAPAGSQLHHKLLAAAAGAIMHGQFGAAQVKALREASTAALHHDCYIHMGCLLLLVSSSLVILALAEPVPSP